MTLYGAAGAAVILQHIDLRVQEGEFLSILGTSGTGKTTLLRVLGGLQKPRPESPSPAESRSRDLPTGWSSSSRTTRVPAPVAHRREERGPRHRGRTTVKAEWAERMPARRWNSSGSTESADEYPWRLSGGMQQRVQIARALAMRPEVLLMDEPFGALDAMTKAQLQDELQPVQEATGTTIVFVTHDVEEAVYLSDRVIVLKGRPADVGVALEVKLDRPRNQITTKEHPDYLGLRHQIYEALGHGAGHA